MHFFPIITTRIRRLRQGNVFTLFFRSHLRGGGSTLVPCSFPGLGSQVFSQGGGVAPIRARGVPQSWPGVPQHWVPPPPPSWDWGTPHLRLGHSIGWDWGTPSPELGPGYPPPGVGYAAGSTPSAVSRRRTFLFTFCAYFKSLREAVSFNELCNLRDRFLPIIIWRTLRKHTQEEERKLPSSFICTYEKLRTIRIWTTVCHG